ncbi:MAG: glycosyltransferase [Candidatus Aminicenantales bacterium]
MPEALTPVSVIIITHNEEQHIRRCLEALKNIDYPKDRFEIIVVDSSSDLTPEIVSEFKNVRLIRSEKGFSQQRNAGIKAASHEIVAFADGHSFVTPGWLRAIHRAFMDDRIAGVGGDALPPPDTGYFGLCAACVGHPAGGAIGFDANVTRTERGVEFVPTCNCAFRRCVLKSVGGFDPFFEDGGEDVDVSRRLREKGYYLEYAPDMKTYHVPRPNLWSFARWNVGVGVTKHNLHRPSLWRILAEPAFPGWLFLVLVGLCVLAGNFWRTVAVLALAWVAYLLFLRLKSRPYALLLRRRKKIGIDWLSVVTVVPFLILVRQVCMNIGQLKKHAQCS